MADHDLRIRRAIEVLKDAQRRAEAVAQGTSRDPMWGPWLIRADQRTIYEFACERALEILSGTDREEV